MARNSIIYSHICPRHGYKKGAECDECIKDETGEGPYVTNENLYKGWYEHIDKHPIYIRDKQHLKEECAKRGLMAKSLMKPKSQGKGYEMR